MSDEKLPAESDTWDRLRETSRRQILKYVATSSVGGFAALGVQGSFRDTDETDGRIELPDDDSKTYDAFVQGREGGYEGVDAAGETIDSGTDGWTVLENSIAAVPDGGSIYINGHYECTSPIDVSKSISVYAQEASVDQQRTGDFVFRFSGQERQRTTLAAAVSTGDRVLELSDAGVQPGDILLLKQTDAQTVLGRGHHPSESHSVKAGGGTTARLADSVVWRDGYEQGTLVYVLNPIEVHLLGMYLRAPP